ncbi:glycoside hydrolase family 2 protein [Clostridium swellfunianum]|uniref:glycoside hydrolase family 2 TIM barrel-domain containing protein n=1 Tax=Clostridium swellfunianum TaxID=1367462 RepID=UPI00202F131D|nr:glycoside hydrolase family 2 TIM barrel-domain containing protein [Clostridium swellfunianum]MCM0647320.1 glycoside hydrolase family 2 protein [Clostridium swellfunianum]
MSRENISLNRDWLYIDNFKEEYIDRYYDDSSFTAVNLPHANKEVPYNYFDERSYQFISCYRKKIVIGSENKDKLLFIDFEGVMTYAKVFCNGQYVGEHKGGYTPFSVEITEKVNFDEENVITVMVDSTERADIPPFGYVIDYLTFGGIYREVSLRIVDKVYINNVFAKTLDALKEDKKVLAEVYVNNQGNLKGDFNLKVSLCADNKVIAEKEEVLELRDGLNNKYEIMLDKLKAIKLWDIDSPSLYEVKISIEGCEGYKDSFNVRVGFREAVVTEEGFYLNGRMLKIRGLNRHQSYPYVGYAMPKRAQRKDADILKYELNINTVRTSHYPQSKHFLDRCDEIGLLVFEEIPGWQHIGNEEWKAVACENVREMITRDWNHPSIFLWGVRINESQDDHDFYSRTNAIAHELDNTRQTGGVRYILNSDFLEDVYTNNDFIHTGKEIVLRNQKAITGLDKNVPYLVTEYCGHIYPTKRFDNEERLIEHALRHFRVQNRMALDKNISGAIGWCAFDYNTHFDFGSGDRICYHGVMDMFRIPKFAAFMYKSQVSPEKELVLEPLTLWSRGERNEGLIVPQVVCTNCEAVELYVEGKLLGKYYPDKENFAGLEYPPVFIHEIPGDWGVSWGDAEFKGYINGKEAVSKIFSRNPVPKAITAAADDLTLHSGDMDSTRITYKIVDQAGNLVPYINESIEFEISGPGEIIGPKLTAFIGGCIAVWVRTTGEKGSIKLKARSSRFEAEEIIVEVL